jgi:hypothetical protein
VQPSHDLSMLKGRFGPNVQLVNFIDLVQCAVKVKCPSLSGPKSVANLALVLLNRIVDKRIDHRLWEVDMLPKMYLE